MFADSDALLQWKTTRLPNLLKSLFGLRNDGENIESCVEEVKKIENGLTLKQFIAENSAWRPGDEKVAASELKKCIENFVEDRFGSIFTPEFEEALKSAVLLTDGLKRLFPDLDREPGNFKENINLDFKFPIRFGDPDQPNPYGFKNLPRYHRIHSAASPSSSSSSFKSLALGCSHCINIKLFVENIQRDGAIFRYGNFRSSDDDSIRYFSNFFLAAQNQRAINGQDWRKMVMTIIIKRFKERFPRVFESFSESKIDELTTSFPSNDPSSSRNGFSLENVTGKMKRSTTPASDPSPDTQSIDDASEHTLLSPEQFFRHEKHEKNVNFEDEPTYCARLVVRDVISDIEKIAQLINRELSDMCGFIDVMDQWFCEFSIDEASSSPCLSSLLKSLESNNGVTEFSWKSLLSSSETFHDSSCSSSSSVLSEERQYLSERLLMEQKLPTSRFLLCSECRNPLFSPSALTIVMNCSSGFLLHESCIPRLEKKTIITRKLFVELSVNQENSKENDLKEDDDDDDENADGGRKLEFDRKQIVESVINYFKSNDEFVQLMHELILQDPVLVNFSKSMETIVQKINLAKNSEKTVTQKTDHKQKFRPERFIAKEKKKKILFFHFWKKLSKFQGKERPSSSETGPSIHKLEKSFEEFWKTWESPEKSSGTIDSLIDLKHRYSKDPLLIANRSTPLLCPKWSPTLQMFLSDRVLESNNQEKDENRFIFLIDFIRKTFVHSSEWDDWIFYS